MRVRLIGTVMVAAMLVLAACGGDNSNATGKTTTSGGAGSGTSTTANPYGSSSVPSGSDLATAFGGSCAQAAAFFSTGITGILSGQASSSDVDKLLNEFDSFASNAPDSIKADAQTMAAAYKKFIQGAKDAGIDLSDPSALSNIANLQKLAPVLESSGLSSPAYETAANHVSAYFAANCSGG